MSNIYRMLHRSKKTAVSCAFLLLFSFSELASASLSGIDPGFPRFIANKAKVNYYKAGGNKFYFDSWNTNNKVFWKEQESMSKERVRSTPLFYTQVDIDASDPNNPQVLPGSFFGVWGKIRSENTGNTLLFKADISDLFWNTNKKIVEFILDGNSQKGAVCDLGFCSFHDEVLRFKMDKFNGKWNKGFSTTARAVATVPLPAAVWLFGSALFGLSAFQRRKHKVCLKMSALG